MHYYRLTVLEIITDAFTKKPHNQKIQNWRLDHILRIIHINLTNSVVERHFLYERYDIPFSPEISKFVKKRTYILKTCPLNYKRQPKLLRSLIVRHVFYQSYSTYRGTV